MAHVKITDAAVTTNRYTDDWLMLPFGTRPDESVTRKQIDWFWDNHSYPRHRANIKEILEALGLDEFDSFKIAVLK